MRLFILSFFTLFVFILFMSNSYGWKIYSTSIEGWNVPHDCEWTNIHCPHEREDAFRDKMCQYGNTVGASYKETDVWTTDFKEDYFGGNDNYYFDSQNAEVGWHSGHGGLSSNYNYFLSVIKNVANRCTVRDNEMVLGENPGDGYANPYPGYMNFAFFDTCCSATLRVIGNLWNTAAHGVHIIGGFNEVKTDPIYCWWWNVCRCDSDAASWVREFVKDVYETGWSISKSFLENLKYETKACPVVIAFGSTLSGCYDRLSNERFNNGYGDATVANYKCYTYWENCNGGGNC